jgi:hypothetical protein
MNQPTGADLIGHVVNYHGSMTDYYQVDCIVVAYDDFRGRYTLDPVRAIGPRSRRLTQVHRTSFFRQHKSPFPVCECGHAVTHRLPEPVCGRCNCPDHRGRTTADKTVAVDGQLSDTELFDKVRTGTETVLYDEHGTPVTVTIPFADYLAQRATAAFHRA